MASVAHLNPFLYSCWGMIFCGRAVARRPISIERYTRMQVQADPEYPLLQLKGWA